MNHRFCNLFWKKLKGGALGWVPVVVVVLVVTTISYITDEKRVDIFVWNVGVVLVCMLGESLIDAGVSYRRGDADEQA
jgi:hypothetical protein